MFISKDNGVEISQAKLNTLIIVQAMDVTRGPAIVSCTMEMNDMGLNSATAKLSSILSHHPLIILL